MKLSALVSVLFVLVVPALATAAGPNTLPKPPVPAPKPPVLAPKPPLPPPASTCQSVQTRKEWRQLNGIQQLEYIGAVMCLHLLPSKSQLMGGKPRTRYDDFLALHISLTDEIHGVGQFLPWHRRLLRVYEEALRTECHYRGAQPYWDMSLDQANFAASPVFHHVFGFGGNGIEVPGSSGPWNNLSFVGGFSGGGCVRDGPFALFPLHVGPGTTATTHCLTRGFNSVATAFIGQDIIANMYNQTSFGQFRIEIEGTPSAASFRIHDAGHLAVAGEMCDRYSSPADPLFYLHHANLDRHWWTWQSQDLGNRLTDISGVSSLNPPFANVTLDYKLKMDVLAPLVAIKDVMDVRSMCYTYA